MKRLLSFALAAIMVVCTFASCSTLEKDDRGVSALYSLADFLDEDGDRIRKDESYEKNYLLGKYGAIPNLKSIDVFRED